MPLDPVLAQGVTPINFAGPDPATKMNQLAMMMKMQGLQSEGQLNALKLTEAQREMADVEAMREAIRGGADFRDPKVASQYGAKGAAMSKALIESDNAELENKTKKVTYARNLWAGAYNQASYDNLLPQLEQLIPGSTANLPPVYDPKVVADNVRDADSILAQYKPQTELGKLIAARDSLSPGDPNRATYDAAINKATTHAPTGQMTSYQAANLEIAKGKESRAATEAKAKEEAAARAVESTAAGAEESARIVTGAIAKAKKLVSPTSTGFGSLLSGIPTTDARALEGQLNVVKANLGFDRLRQMREESKTGGALGSIAVKELERLEAAVATLDTGLEGQQLIDALDAVSTHYNNWLTERQKLTKKTGAAGEGTPAQPENDSVSKADALLQKYPGK